MKPAPKATIETVIDDAIGVLAIGLAALRADIEKIRKGKGPASKHDAASRIAFLTGKVGGIADAARKLEAARAKRLGLTPAVVIEYLRQLDATERAGLLHEASLIDARKSGLG
jgi:hypothetical protein